MRLRFVESYAYTGIDMKAKRGVIHRKHHAVGQGLAYVELPSDVQHGYHALASNSNC